VIDYGEELDVGCLEHGFKLSNGIGDGMLAGNSHNAIYWDRGHGGLLGRGKTDVKTQRVAEKA
jgi:hypothetical protein